MADAQSWKQILAVIATRKSPIVLVSATSKTTNALLESASLAKAGNLEEAFQLAESIRLRHTNLIEEFLGGMARTPTQNMLREGHQHVDVCVDELKNYLLGVYTLGELTHRSLDRVSSLGERLSSYLLALCGKAAGYSTNWIDARYVMKTDRNFGAAQPDISQIEEQSILIKNQVEAGQVPILGGYYGSDSSGNITTLGRGGSDYSASLFGAALRAEAIEIWTDVSGMYTCDPRVVKTARSIPEISFNEAAELAYFGAKVLHPATILPAVEKNIPVYVKNTFEPEHPGTRISENPVNVGSVRAIAFKKNITVLTVGSSRMLMAYGFMSKVFSIFEGYKKAVDLVSTSEVSISITVDDDKHLTGICRDLEKIGEVEITADQALISLVGQSFLGKEGIAAQAFSALGNIPIRMISQGNSEHNLSLVVSNEDVNRAVNHLHKTFFENE